MRREPRYEGSDPRRRQRRGHLSVLERVAVELLTIVARLVTNRDTARALLDAAYATMEASVDELEIAKLAALDKLPKPP